MNSEQEKSVAVPLGGLRRVPTHSTVPVVSPRCAGKAGGKAHRGTRSPDTSKPWKRRAGCSAAQIIDLGSCSENNAFGPSTQVTGMATNQDFAARSDDKFRVADHSPRIVAPYWESLAETNHWLRC
jgi:hypothetical protein